MTQQLIRKLLVMAAVAALPLAPACKKKENGKNGGGTEAYKEIEKTFDDTEPPPAERKPVEGADVSALEKPMQVRFEALADKLPSPCGKAHSLRTSRNTDKDCKRAPFAVDYLYELTKDGATDSQIKELYALRFKESQPITFGYDPKTPHHGPTDAPVKVVEFYDYGCPACAAMKPVIEEALKGMETEVVIYYKQFPLSAHPDSVGAAQAALAAHEQGKFDEMHKTLFANQHTHKLDNLKEYAGMIGLDMSKFQADYEAAKALVDADKAEGEEAGITGTPSIYINGRPYEGPSDPKYFKMWLAESLAEAI